MGRRIAIKPIEPLVLEFADGTTKEAVFTNEALIYLTQEFGDISKLMEDEISKPYELAAKILYSGMKVMDNTVTLDEAKSIVVGGGVEIVTEIYNFLSECFGEIDPEEVKKNIAPLVNKMARQRK